MTKFTKRAAAVLTASLMLAGVVSGCGNNANNETPSTGSNNEDTKVYKIVADNSFAPFDFMDPDTMEYTGIDIAAHPDAAGRYCFSINQLPLTKF